MNWERARDRPEGWEPGATGEGDEHDWFFRATVEPDTDAELVFDGLATVATVLVDGAEAARSETMWMPVRVPLSAGRHEVTVHCHALAPLLATPRRPRARWRTAVCDNALRWQRTTLLGRAPGFAPGPPVVGLWRGARLEQGGDPLAAVRLRPRLEHGDGVVAVTAPPDAVTRLGDMELRGSGELRLAGAPPWFPHTHGRPALHDVELERGGATAVRRVGFRTVSSPGAVERDGIALHVNGVPVFVRGAVWTGVGDGERRATLERAVGLGLNAIRVAGIGVYESDAFHDDCDELGLLVWQDLMFANLDAPFGDEQFRARCRAEVAHQLERVAGRPSLMAVCGSSESEQQVAMVGLDADLARTPFFTDDVPALLAAADVGALWVPSAPCGETRPFRPSEGVSNWFGVGGYRRPLTDTRRAAVRFASECLALANVPDGAAADERDRGVPRDTGADWDFADVRDFYLGELFGIDPGTLDPARYTALSRAVSGEVMAEVFGEWRRAGSPCGGGFVLWLRDRRPGAGWGLLDSDGAPKAVCGPLARALAPVTAWTTDEGQDGLAVHAVNDGPEPVAGELRLTVYRDCEQVVAEVTVPLELGPHSGWSDDAERLLGGWIDISYAYRFGPPQHDLVVVAFAGSDRTAVHARFPAGWPLHPLPAERLGLSLRRQPGGVVLTSRRAAIGVRVDAAAVAPADDGILVEPGRDRFVACTADGPVAVTALNLDGEVSG